MHLNWGQIFILPDKTCQHMSFTLQNQKIYATKVKGSKRISEGPSNVALTTQLSVSMMMIYVLLSKPHNRPLFVTCYIRK